MKRAATAAEKRHMNRVAALGCILCDYLGLGATPAQVHHIREGQGMSQRASNFLTIPLCPEHHQDKTGIHGLGTNAFERTYGRNRTGFVGDGDRTTGAASMVNTLRWTQEQLAAHRQRIPSHASASPLPIATGTARKPDMNKTEAEYAGMLKTRQSNGEILWWQYEAVTLKLADNTRYTPDFLVMRSDGSLEIHETKGGFVREDGWLKLKIAAALFPFRFFLCQKQANKAGGGWQIRMV